VDTLERPEGDICGKRLDAGQIIEGAFYDGHLSVVAVELSRAVRRYRSGNDNDLGTLSQFFQDLGAKRR